MNTLKTILAAAAFAAAFTAPAGAQEAQKNTFPEACRFAGGMDHGSMGGMSMATNDHQKAAEPGMARMDKDMMDGMMADDADVAFICGMIAHHQGAIDMAKVELQYGDDAWAKEMAQKVIDAQTQEIADMTKWVQDNVKK